MAIGKYNRIDNRRSSSSYCSTVTIVVFVALCLVGVWMMTSSSVVPVQNVDVSQENKNEVKEPSEVKEQVSDSNDSSTRQFEDNPGDLPEDATKGDSNVASENNNNSFEKQEEKTEEKSSEDARKEDGDQRTEDGDSKTENTETNSEDAEKNKDNNEISNKGEVEENSSKSDSDESEKKADSGENETKSESDDDKNSVSDESEKKSDSPSETADNKIQETVEQDDNKGSDENSSEKSTDENAKNQSSNEVYPSGAQSELLNESTSQTGSFPTQAAESKNEKESQESSKQPAGYNWKLCNVTAGPDFIPCLDNWKGIRSLRSTKHYEHRERHCPEEHPTCLVTLPEGYRRPVQWPKSREKVEID